MDILTSFFHRPRCSAVNPDLCSIQYYEKESKGATAMPKAPHHPKTRKKSKKSPQRNLASSNLRGAIVTLLHALQERGLSSKILEELNNHFSLYEYNFVLTKATSCFKSYYPCDAELVRLLLEAWTCQWRYLTVVIREADENYWERQEKEVFVPVKEAEYRLRLERAIIRCQDIRKELSDRQVSLAFL